MAEVEIRLEDNRILEFVPAEANAPRRLLSLGTLPRISAAKADGFRGVPAPSIDLVLVDDVNPQEAVAVEIKSSPTKVRANAREQARAQAAKLQRTSAAGTRVVPQLWELDLKRGSLRIWELGANAQEERSRLYFLSRISSQPTAPAGGISDQQPREGLNTELIQRRAQDWRDRVETLFGRVEAWLRESYPGFVAERRSTARMDEELKRKFAVEPIDLPVLEIARENKIVLVFKPYGLWIIGANGRIDISGIQQSAFLVDTAEHFQPADWRLYARGTLMHGVPFSAETLGSILPA